MSYNPFIEASLETAIAELFTQQGYTHQLGSDLVRKNKREVVLQEELSQFLRTDYAKASLRIKRELRHLDIVIYVNG